MTQAKRYFLDFNSSGRNRKFYPSQSEFGVMVDVNSPSTLNTSRDPVSAAAPVRSWTGQRFTANAAVSSSIQGHVEGPPGLGATNSRRVIVFKSDPGALQRRDDYYAGAVVTVGIESVARITSYEYMGNDIGKVTVDADVAIEPMIETLTISDPSDVVDPAYAKLFVPAGADLSNAYTGLFIFNESLNESREIKRYDGVTRIASVGGAPVPTWLPSQNYSIRAAVPIYAGVAEPGSSRLDIVVNGGPSTSTVTSGFFVRTVPSVYDNSAVEYFRAAASYDGTTVRVFPALPTDPTAYRVEFLQFTRDNATSVVYTGIPETEAAPYSLKLKSVTLPNVPLLSRIGGKTTLLPYVYVQLTADDIPAVETLMTNVPNASKMTFKATIRDYVSSDNVFISAIGDDMTQIMRFKADTNFKVKITLPNGDPFITEQSDDFSPRPPNPRLQICALFELVRLA